MNVAPLSKSELIAQARAFCAKKKLGQHFLVDEDALSRIAALLELSENDEVLEIGPGLGFLTRLLCASGARVAAVDLDRESCAYLRSLNFPNLTVHHGDFLGYDLNTERFSRTSLRTEKDDSTGSSREPSTNPIKVAGNIPYQITGLILGHLFGEIGQPAPWLSRIERIVLLVQHEVALRMVAAPGTEHYAQVSLFIRYVGEASLEFRLPPGAFFPPPQVNSAVVVIRPGRIEPLDCNDHRYLGRVVRAGFAQRRKMLRNALSSLGIASEAMTEAFRKLDMDPQVRAESLSLNQFAMLANALKAATE